MKNLIFKLMDLWKPIKILEDCWNVDHVAQCRFPVDRN